LSRIALTDNTEEVAVRVFKDDEIFIGFICPRVTHRSYLEEPFYFSVFVVRIDVEVQPIPALKLLRNLIQRHIHILLIRVSKDHPAAAGWFSGNVV